MAHEELKFLNSALEHESAYSARRSALSGFGASLSLRVANDSFPTSGVSIHYKLGSNKIAEAEPIRLQSIQSTMVKPIKRYSRSRYFIRPADFFALKMGSKVLHRSAGRTAQEDPKTHLVL